MSLPRSVVCFAALLTLSACDAGPTGPASADLAPSFAVGGPVGLATGSGHVSTSSGRRVFTFHAKDNGDGTARGSYRIRLIGPDLFFSVAVSCMAVEGNTAWIAGHISDTNASFIEVGSVSYFYAIDHGEGAGAPADVVSTARINDAEGEDVAFCADRLLLLPSFPIGEGNVQVR